METNEVSTKAEPSCREFSVVVTKSFETEMFVMAIIHKWEHSSTYSTGKARRIFKDNILIFQNQTKTILLETMCLERQSMSVECCAKNIYKLI